MEEILVIDVSGSTPNGRGTMTFKSRPIRGEWIEIDEEGTAAMFEVVMVAHSTVGAGHDLYVRRIDATALAIKSICAG